MRNLRTRIKRKLEIRQASGLVAPIQNANDFYLVEYPKSGITWLSVLLANTFLINQGSASRATFTSVRAYIPDLHVTKQTLAVEFNNPQVRFYKSHAKFHPAYVNIVYLVRHPVDVMKSYFRFRSSLGHYNGSFEGFCFGPNGAVETWRRHVASWLIYPHNTNQRFIHLVRYEDLISNTEDELCVMAQNFGWHLNTSAVAQGVTASARNAMRKQEALYRSRNPAHRMEFVSTGAEQTFDADALKKIVMLCKPELELLGYKKIDEAR